MVGWEVGRSNLDAEEFFAGSGAFFMGLFLYGGAGCIPGLAIWFVILGRLPREWSHGKQRVLTVATAPLVGDVLAD
jgi:hypothetical protein